MLFDHINDNNLDIVTLTETWLSNEEVNNRRVGYGVVKSYITFLGILVVLVVAWVY